MMNLLLLLTKWHIRGHGQTDLSRKGRGFCEEVEITERKGESNGFLHLNDNSLLFLIYIGSLGKLDITWKRNTQSYLAGKDRALNFKQNSRRTTQHSRGLHTSIVVISLWMKRREIN